MKCGHCKQSHDTVAEVQQCYGIKPSAGSATAQAHGTATNVVQMAPPLTRAEGDKKMGQYEFMNKLRAERGLPEFASYEEAAAQFNKRSASAEINRLMALPKAVAPKQVRDSSLMDIPVPEGGYAIPSIKGANDFDFYVVDKPTEGKWAGYLFIKQVVGGKPRFKVEQTARKRRILETIAEEGWEACAQLFARELKICFKCRRELTKHASRMLGCGRDCAGKIGWGEEWDTIQHRWEAKQAGRDSGPAKLSKPARRPIKARAVRRPVATAGYRELTDDESAAEEATWD